MTTAARPRSRRKATPFTISTDLDPAIAAAERDAIVVWHGERLPYATLPERIAVISERRARNALFRRYLEAVDAINPLREERLSRIGESARKSSHPGVVEAMGATIGFAPDDLAVEMQRFLAQSETVYFAALRRCLALVDIEQGDATVADLWHLQTGGGWGRWFDERRLGAAIEALGDGAPSAPGEASRSAWLDAADRLAQAGRGIAGANSEAVGVLYASILSDPEWLIGELGMAGDQAMAFVDFVAFWRLWRIRRDAAYLAYELRLYRTEAEGLRRAYFSGIASLVTGVDVPAESYLADVAEPFASGARLRAELLGAMADDVLRARHGATWWREDAATETVPELTVGDDGVAQLGYDAIDWRPVLRQIRTQLIGEMSGYGGPNITTRAGTRKV